MKGETMTETKLRCIGCSELDGLGWHTCDQHPVYRTPYRSTFPQRPICHDCASGHGSRTPEVVSPYSKGSEFHYTTL
jgi:hypothetical protein